MAKSEAAAVKDPATKGKLKLIIMIVVGLLLAIGVSVGATWYFMHSAQSKPAAAAAEVAPVGKQPAIFEPMAPAFVANYTVNGRQRYMQVSITLQGRNQADLEALRVHMPLIRNNLVMLFSGQSFDTLATPSARKCCARKPRPACRKWLRKSSAKW